MFICLIFTKIYKIIEIYHIMWIKVDGYSLLIVVFSVMKEIEKIKEPTVASRFI